MKGKRMAIVAILILLFVLVLFLPGYWLSEANAAGTFPSLKSVAADNGILVGVNDDHFNTPYFNNTIPPNFDSVTPGNRMEFKNIHPCPPEWMLTPTDPDYSKSVTDWVIAHGDLPPIGQHDDYDCWIAYAEEDEWEWGGVTTGTTGLMNWAGENNVGVYMTPLVWYLEDALPPWLDEDTVITSTISLSLAARERLMEDHIKTIISQYCSFQRDDGEYTVYAADIVNEAFDSNGTIREVGIWWEISDFIDKAYRFADEARMGCLPSPRPDLKLMYNDFGFEYDGYTGAKVTGMIAYLDPLIDNGMPLDGIGFQTHLFYDPYATDPAAPHNFSQLTATMSRINRELGVEVKITEVDVTFWDSTYYDRPIVYPLAATGVQTYYVPQAEVFAEIAWACIVVNEVSTRNGFPGCTGYTIWGTNDQDTWRYWWMRNSRGISETLAITYLEYLDPLLFWDRNDKLWNPSKSACITPVLNPRRPTTTYSYCPKPAYYRVYDMFAAPLPPWPWPETIFLPLISHEEVEVFTGPYPPPPSAPFAPPAYP